MSEEYFKKQDVLDIFRTCYDTETISYDNGNEYINYEDAVNSLNELSVVKLPSCGHLIGIEYDGYADGNPVYNVWQCSECGWVYEGEDPSCRYCPDCGVKFID